MSGTTRTPRSARSLSAQRRSGAAAQKLGAKLLNIYWTVGQYDLMAVVEAPDDEAVAALLLQPGGVGTIRTHDSAGIRPRGDGTHHRQGRRLTIPVHFE